MEINAAIRSRIFFGIIIAALLVVITTAALGSKQDQRFLENTTRFQQGVSYINNAQYKEAITVFQSLDPGFSNSPQAYYYIAFCYAGIKDYKNAASYMYKTQLSRPAVLLEPNFLYASAQYLYYIGEYDRARLYLQKGLAYTKKDSALNQDMDQLLDQMNAKKPVGVQ